HRCPIDSVPYTNGQPIWLRPELVVEVKFSGWTQDKIMRTPIFLRFRDDKMPNECIIEGAQQGQQQTDTRNLGHVVILDKYKQKEKRDFIPDQKFSNIDKIFWTVNERQKRPLTKRDLIEYYDKISKYILPHLHDRPLSLKRYPDGIGGKSFFHKNWIQEKPNHAKTIQIFSASKNGITNYLICNNKETLLWLANLGCIEMHPWYSRVLDYKACTHAANHSEQVPPGDEDNNCGLDTPDYIVFDLDPYIYSGREKGGQEPEYNAKGFKAAVDAALDLRDLLDGLNIESFVKTSGKTGLHVFVPVAPVYTYDQTRNFAETIGKMLRRRNPDKITMEWNSSNRKGKVFFDYNQNARGKTLASIFSVRPTISATISMPVKWRQLSGIQPTDFTLVNASDILSANGDAWSDIYQKKQDLLKIIQEIS
ncbi:MAG TPA: non-homologous end-joining DNA ligase, partial [Nitrososphaera sp.]